jgi:hypothetical protein
VREVGLKRGRGEGSEKVETSGEEAEGCEGNEDSDMSEIEYYDITRVRKMKRVGDPWSNGEIKRYIAS